MDVLYPDKAEDGLVQLESFAALLKEEPDARRLLENPTIAGERRNRLLQEIASALGFDKRVRNFVGILLDKGRLELLEEIIDAYRRLLDDRMGIVRALVTAARPLDVAEQNELAAKLMERTGKKIRMEVAIDASLIGGVVAQVGSTIYDGSVRTQLQAFKNRLVEET
jgi:F-type H+-transporting ATPase subunit delta